MNELKKRFINAIIISVIKLREKKKILLIAISIILIISLITVAVLLMQDRTSKLEEEEAPINEEQLEMQFSRKFTSQGNEYVSTLYHIEETDTGKYEIEANIPYSHISPEIDNAINKEINDIFITKLLQIYNTSQTHSIFKIDYTVAINNNILSLVIKCILKEGNNAQRTIIKTYNYNIENNQKIDILELIAEEKREEIQNKINQKIQKQIEKENTIIGQGYNVYRRDPDSDIYILENATEFYVEDNILYIIYSYGNNNYTSEIDLIINKI